jgi:AraC-like DNA-binding protein
VLAVVAQGAKRTFLGNQAFDYARGQYLVSSLDLPITGSVVIASPERPLLACALTLAPGVIASLILESPTNQPRGGKTVGIAVSEMTDELLDPLVRLLRLLDHPEDVPVLFELIEREILWRLLQGEQGSMVRQIGLANSRLSQISRSIRWMRAHYAEVFPIEDLAEIAGMSVSSFHRSFRAATTMSPLQYQKQIRLQEARSRLVSGSSDISSVGFSVGYDSPSQFIREYRRQFGISPGKDAERIRSSINNSEGTGMYREGIRVNQRA